MLRGTRKCEYSTSSETEDPGWKNDLLKCDFIHPSQNFELTYTTSNISEIVKRYLMVTASEGYPTLVRLFMRYDGLPRRSKFAKDWGGYTEPQNPIGIFC
jgi:hypothetical protein